MTLTSNACDPHASGTVRPCDGGACGGTHVAHAARRSEGLSLILAGLGIATTVIRRFNINAVSNNERRKASTLSLSADGTSSSGWWGVNNDVTN